MSLVRGSNDDGRLVEALGRVGDSEAVYLVRKSVLSLSFVEPHKRDKPNKPDRPDEPDLHHAQRREPGTFYLSGN